MTIHIDHAALGRMLKHEMRGPIDALAEQIADNARAHAPKVGDRDGGGHEAEMPVKVLSYTTDRAAALVMLAHPSGLAVQAKHGTLTRAASAAGIRVVTK